MVMTAESFRLRWSFHSGLTRVVSLCVLLRLSLRLPLLFLLPLSRVCRLGILEFVARLYSKFCARLHTAGLFESVVFLSFALPFYFLLHVLLHFDFFLMV